MRLCYRYEASSIAIPEYNENIWLESWKMDRRLNCWEYKDCGYGPNRNKGKGKTCPTLLESRLDGVHNGIKAGRACWVVAGTYCGGEVQGKFAQKYATCMNCDFYQKVLFEEGHKFEITLVLMKRLREG